MKVVVIQTYKTENVPDWIIKCLKTVENWSRMQGYDYHFFGDEVFDVVPSWYLDKVREKLPVATDFARLLLLQKALDSAKYERAIWFDADTLIFDQSLTISFETSCAFGQEIWVQKVGTKYQAVKNVHNAVCAFNLHSATLPFLIETVESIIRRIDSNRIAPQIVGPKLLTALHNIAGFSLLPEIGALSPEVVSDIVTGGGKALDLLRLKSQSGLKAANLCASLLNDDLAEEVVKKVLIQKVMQIRLTGGNHIA